MKILFVVFPEAGHLHPFIGIAQRLVAAGHSIAVFSQEDLSARLAAAGLQCPVFFSRATLADRPVTRHRSRAFAERLGQPAWARKWYAYVLLGTVQAQVEALRVAVREWRPDVLCADSMAYAAAIVGELEAVPWAAVSTMLVPLAPLGWRCLFLDILDAQAEARAEIFAANGVTGRFKYGEAISPWLNTVFTTDELVPRNAANNDFSHYVGPSSPLNARGDEPDFPWARLCDDRPLVYVAFGSQLSPAMHVIDHIARSLAPSEADLVIALNDHEHDQAARTLPEHVIKVRYAPQLALLDRAAVMVSHGGANSVAECLARGCPMLIIPLVHDQPLQAHFIEQSGSGAALAHDDVTMVGVRDLLLPLIAREAPARRRAHSIAESYRAHDGAERTGELLLELARTRQSLVSHRV